MMTQRQRWWKAWWIKNRLARNTARREVYRANPEPAKKISREFRAANPKKISLINKFQYNKNRKEILKARAKARRANPELARLKEQDWRRRCITLTKIKATVMRRMALLRYGRICQCCGEWRREFLALDHINGVKPEGLPRQGIALHIKLKNLNWPKGFQVLCHNCNQAEGFYGYCPHKLAAGRIPV